MGCCEGREQRCASPSPQLDQPSRLLAVYWGRFAVRVVRIQLETLLKAGGRIRARLKKKGIFQPRKYFAMQTSLKVRITSVMEDTKGTKINLSLWDLSGERL